MPLAKEVGEEDIADEEFDDGYEDAVNAKEEEEAKPARRFGGATTANGAGLLGVKKQVGTKTELKPKTDSENRAPLTAWELFRDQKRSEASTRDLGAKAICKIKHGIRQPNSQKDGRPYIPEDWDRRFKPVLGSFKKFILMRPDQFRIVAGSTPDMFTLEVVSNQTVVAPSFDSKGKGKKGKGKVKGTSWDAIVHGKDGGKSFGKGKKGKDKGKDFKGKGKGKDKGKDKGKGKASFIGTSAWTASVAEEAEEAAEEPAPKVARKAPVIAAPTRAAKLLAEAAKEALAEEEEEENEFEEEAGEEEQAADEQPAEEEEANAEEGAPEEEEDAGVDEDPMEQLFKASADAEEDTTTAEEAPAKPDAAASEEPEEGLETSKHGSFITSFLSGGLLGGRGVKRAR